MSSDINSRLKTAVNAIPGVNYIAHLAWGIFMLPRNEQAHRASLGNTTKQLDSISNTISEIKEAVSRKEAHVLSQAEKIETLGKRVTNINGQLSDIKHQLHVSTEPASPQQPKTASPKSGGDEKELLADDHRLDEYYIAFENKFRGTEEVIKERLEVYLPYFQKLKLDFKKHPVLDIGCGRGEMLQILKEAHIAAVGIDLNERMVLRAKEKGLVVEQAEALSYLMSKKTGSFSAITGFHLAEHIPFQLLLRLFEECYRVLAPGGFIIFETPNPESLHVGSFSFYFDPSHLNPLPPDVLAFTVENRGFDSVDILRLHPKDEVKAAEASEDEKSKQIVEVLSRFYGPQDYAIIGYKAD